MTFLSRSRAAAALIYGSIFTSYIDIISGIIYNNNE